MNKIDLILFLSSLLSLTICNGQGNSFSTDPASAFNSYVNLHPSEKTYINTDKDMYNTNETIWLELYLLDGNSLLNSEKSQLLYIDLLNENDSLIIEKKLYVENRSSNGHIDLNSSLDSGVYTLRAYTRYMQNENNPVPFENQIIILNHKLEPKRTSTIKTLPSKPFNHNNLTFPKSELQLNFFPEGGSMVSGIETSVAIKITDKSGKGIATEGKIVDEENKIVCFFKSQEFGLGVFKILPLANKKYFAVLSDNLQYELPKPLAKGYILNIKNKDDVVLIDITTNIPKGLGGLYLLGHLRGQLIYKQRIPSGYNSNSYKIRVLNRDGPSGLVQFTLFSVDGDPICERSLFVDQSSNEVTLSIDSISESYTQRQEVSTKLSVIDNEGKQVSANVSLSVSSIDRLNISTKNHTIKNWLLLNSDIDAALANPEYFFEDNSRNKRNLLDALLITKNRSLYNWKRVLGKENTYEMNIRPEKGIIITGRIVNFKNQQEPKRANVKLNLLGLIDDVYEEKKVSDENGRFTFGPYVFSDTLKAVITAESFEKRRNGKSKKISVLIEDQPSIHKKISKNSLKNSYILQEQKIASPKSTLTSPNRINFKKNPNVIDFERDSNVIELDEAIVSDKKKTRNDSINLAFKKLKPLYSSPTRRIFPDSLTGTHLRVIDFLMPFGARFQGAFPNEKIVLGLRFGDSPSFVVDGVVVDSQFIDALNTDDIEFIDVLLPGTAGAYSNIAKNGVVVIYSKGSLNLPQKRKQVIMPNIKGFEVTGFSSAKNFIVTDYSESKPEHSEQDHRSTLHWQPNIQINNSKQQNSSDVSFYTNDIPGKYVIKAEGITTDGRPLTAMRIFEINEK
ncbi:hypothetical protein [Aurantibacter sp.]|uniref:hypothetical protein n=1 Tax=Aurantibacter sp. TaxID=2807103 RepID=UPI003265083D